MTDDDIIRMAREAGFQTGVIHGADGSPIQTLVQHISHSCIVELERFYALAVAKEREACAQVCDLEAAKWPYPSHANAAVTVAATAIRARKETK